MRYLEQYVERDAETTVRSDEVNCSAWKQPSTARVKIQSGTVHKRGQGHGLW